MTGPANPVICPACGKRYILVTSEPRPNNPTGMAHILVYTHDDGTKCDEPARQRRVVLVEGERALRELTVLALEEEGYKVAAADNAEDGMRTIGAGVTDLVVIDYGTGAPMMVEQLEQRSQSMRPAVIVVSGTAPQLPTSGCVKAWLAKPFTTKQLTEACASALGIASRR